MGRSGYNSAKRVAIALALLTVGVPMAAAAAARGGQRAQVRSPRVRCAHPGPARPAAPDPPLRPHPRRRVHPRSPRQAAAASTTEPAVVIPDPEAVLTGAAAQDVIAATVPGSMDQLLGAVEHVRQGLQCESPAGGLGAGWGPRQGQRSPVTCRHAAAPSRSPPRLPLPPRHPG